MRKQGVFIDRLRRYVRDVRARLGALAATLLAAGSASGAEPGVHVDPDSPAAKEYGIPLEQGRSAGGGGSGADGALFGAGITPSSSSDTTSPPADFDPAGEPETAQQEAEGTAEADEFSQAPGAGSDTSPQSPAGSSTPQKIESGGDGGNSAALMLAGLLVVVLGGGALLAAVLRRFQSV